MKCRKSSLTSVSAVGGDDSQRNPKVGIPVLDQKSYTVSKMGRRCLNADSVVSYSVCIAREMKCVRMYVVLDFRRHY